MDHSRRDRLSGDTVNGDTLFELIKMCIGSSMLIRRFFGIATHDGGFKARVQYLQSSIPYAINI